MHHQQSRRSNAIKFLVAQFIFLSFALVLLALPVTTSAATCSGSLDYGDAPASYGNACATPSATLRIGGTTPDPEATTQSNNFATGDGADESFLNPLTPIDVANSQYIWSVPVSNSTGSSATLAGWIDWNKNGTFDSNELASATVVNNATVVTLTWSIPPTGTSAFSSTLPITTYVRLRIIPSTNAGDIQPTGNLPALNSIGEVEDYAVALVESDVCAPGTSFYVINGSTAGNYTIETLDGNTGTHSALVDPPFLGQINGIAVDRYRAQIYFQNATPGSPGTPAKGLFGYNVLNGTFFTVTTDVESSPLNIVIPTDGWRNASGAFSNGKYYAGVDGEDPTANLNQPGTIWEITLDSAGTSPVSARALVTPSGSMGGDTITNAVNYGDVIIVANRLYVTYYVVAGGGGFHHYFDVYDINSQILLSRQDLGSNTDGNPIQLGRDGNGQLWAVRNNTGTTASTYQINTATNTITGWSGSPTASVNIGIADASECPIVPMDFGDAPSYYSPNVGPLAARSGLTSTIHLGAISSTSSMSDTHGNASSTANGDDITGGSDDEDAITGSLATWSSSASTYTITNISVFNNTGSPATLYGWIDYDRDGVFEQSERVTVTVPSNAAQQSVTLTWTIPSNGKPTTGQSFLRLRLSTDTTTDSTSGAGDDGAFLATGYSANGEVEDYPLTIGSTTAVVLTSFNAAGMTENTFFDMVVRGVGIGAAAAILILAAVVFIRNRRRDRFDYL